MSGNVQKPDWLEQNALMVPKSESCEKDILNNKNGWEMMSNRFQINSKVNIIL